MKNCYKIIWGVTYSHDSSITELNLETGVTKTIELEKYFNEKHFFLDKDVIENKITLDEFVDKISLLINSGALSAPDTVVIFNFIHWKKTINHFMHDFCRILHKKYGTIKNIVNRGCSGSDFAPTYQHHKLHHISSYSSSPFETAFIYSSDGGGDLTCGATSIIKKGELTDYFEYPDIAFPSQVITAVGFLCKNLISPHIVRINTTEQLDLAGKLMGLSSYGKDLKREDSFIDFYKQLMWSRNFFTKWTKSFFNTTDHLHLNPFNRFPTPLKSKFDIQRKPIWTEEEEIIHSYSVQKATEEWTIEFLETPQIKTAIESCGGNIVLTGGCALNVLTNERIKKELGYNVYVAPDPGDSNLSHGLVINYAADYFNYKIPQPSKRNPRRFSDLKISDLGKHVAWWRKNKSCEKTTVAEISKLLKEGEIIGLIQGNIELGPRALGNRSILCDPSFKNARDKINKNIKNREWYRPFAPVCKLEDAAKYFDSPSFNYMEHMSFVVDVKPEYRDKYPAITHVDNTARLQTVTKESNELLYNLLDEFDGILLNTSFNVMGKPILNLYDTAFNILQETDLNRLVVKAGEDLYIFTP